MCLGPFVLWTLKAMRFGTKKQQQKQTDKKKKEKAKLHEFDYKYNVIRI